MPGKPGLDFWLDRLIEVDRATGSCDSEAKPLIATMLKLRQRLVFVHDACRHDNVREFALSISAQIEMRDMADDTRLMWCGITNGDDTVLLVERGPARDRRYGLYASGPRGTEVLLPLAVMVI